MVKQLGLLVAVNCCGYFSDCSVVMVVAVLVVVIVAVDCPQLDGVVAVGALMVSSWVGR